MTTYILLDAYNLFFRCKYSVQGDIETRAGLALHMILTSIKKVWKDFKGDHLVVCLDGKSWRRDFYPEYKMHRQVQAELRTPREKEDDVYYFDVLNEFIKFLIERTNVTVLQAPRIEADDWVARWIHTHQNDNHFIISSDSDFFQLLSPNVSIYDGIKQHLIQPSGVYDDNGQVVIDKKTNKPMNPPQPEWALFSKIMRGDPSDNIMSAYPGARDKSSKKKTGLLEAFEDRNSKGYSWNNVMQTRWTDHNGIERRVIDEFEKNQQLVDLSRQPVEIKEQMDLMISEQISKEPKAQIGVWFLKFCHQYQLDRISKNPRDYSAFLSSSYPKENHASRE